MNEKRKLTYREKYQAALAIRAARADARRTFRPVIMRQHELKVVDGGVQDSGWLNSGGVTYNMCIPNLGTDFNQRIGRKIFIKQAYLRFELFTEFASIGSTSGSLATIPPQNIRVIIFYDKQPNGTTATAADLLQQANPLSMTNLNNRDRFDILYDKMINFDTVFIDGGATKPFIPVSPQSRTWKKFLKINKEVIFNANSTGTPVDINSGNLGLFFIGSGTGSPVQSRCAFTSRVRFADD